MPEKKRLWLARHKTESSWYVIGYGRPKFEGEFACFGVRDEGCLRSFCPYKFESITGIHLKPGEVREVESITVKLVEKRSAKLSDPCDKWPESPANMHGDYREYRKCELVPVPAKRKAVKRKAVK